MHRFALCWHMAHSLIAFSVRGCQHDAVFAYIPMCVVSFVLDSMRCFYR